MSPKKRKFKPDYAPELYFIAKQDLISAEGLAAIKKGRPENILFLVHQAVEKAIKAVLISQSKEVLLTHDLEALLVLLPDSMQPPWRDELIEFSTYATVRRYETGTFVITDAEIESALKVGNEMMAWAQKILK